MERASRDDAGTAVETLVRRHHDAVYASAFRLLRDRAEAEDVAQDVFLALARDPGRLERSEEPERALRWLAVRTALDRLRRARHRHARERRFAARTGSPARSPADLAEDADAREALEAELALLDPDLRVALELRFREGLAFAAIGAATGVSEPSAHDRVARGLAALRARLARRGLGAYAAAGALERGLSGAGPIDAPPGLEQALLEAARAAARSGGTGSGVASATPGAIGAPGAIGTIGTPGLAGALATLRGTPAWLVLALGAAGLGALVVRAGLAQRPAPPRGIAALERSPHEAEPAAHGERAALELPLERPVDPDAAARRPAPAGAGAEGAPAAGEPRGRLAGAVVDAEGLPLAGALVHAASTERSGKPPRFEALARTDAAGRFALEVPVARADGQQYRVEASLEGWIPRASDPVRARAGRTATLPPLALDPDSDDALGAFTLAVAATDAAGAPVEGAEVALVREVRGRTGALQREVEARGRTDAGGLVELAGRRLGAKTLEVDARSARPEAGIARVALAIAAPGRVRRDVVVPPGFAIEGRVLAVDGGEARGLALHAAAAGGSGATSFAAERGPAGAFEVRGLSEGAYDLRGGGAGWSPFRIEAVQAGARDLVVFAKRADDPRDLGEHLAELHGVAVAAEDGTPLALDWRGLNVVRLPDGPDAGELARDAIPNALEPVVAQVMLGPGGPPPPSAEIHVTGLEPGRYLLVAFAEGRAAGVLGPVELAARELRAGLVLAVPRGTRVAARVRDGSGAPVEGARLVVTGDGPLSRERVLAIDAALREIDGAGPVHRGERGPTDARGAAELAPLPPLPGLRLAAVHPDFEPGWSAPIRPDGAEIELEIVLGPRR